MKDLNRIISILFDKWWFRHLVFWIFLVNYFAWGYGFINQPVLTAYRRSLTLIISSMMVVYPVLYYLIPEHLVKHKLVSFFLGYAVLISGSAVIRGYLQQVTGLSLTHYGFESRIGNNILPYTYICCIATAVKLIRVAYFERENAEAAEQDKNYTELQLLKTQIHPHFLFNTLNSLYSHTRQNTDVAPQIILTLSDLLRFMIYESQAEFIPLKKEIQLLKNYVELEKFRYGDEIDISLSFSGETNDVAIRPLLLLPLLENCFKHGLHSELDQKWITMDLNVENSIMHLNLANSWKLEVEVDESERAAKGLSLENVKRRVELYYPGEHSFMIKEETDMFLVKLELRLKRQQVEAADIYRNETNTYDFKMSAGR